MYRKFYHRTIQRNITAFATLFDGIHIDLANGKEVRVPIHYSPKAKFIDVVTRRPDLNNLVVDIQLPVMGFELVSLNYAPERNKNRMNRIISKNGTDTEGEYIYNKVPYDMQFELYVATTRLEDGHKIVEQILPFFAPELTIAIKALDGIADSADIHIILTSVSPSVEYEAGMSEKRIIMWQMSFTVKTHLYSDVKTQQKIINAYVDISTDSDNDDYFKKITERVYLKEQ